MSDEVITREVEASESTVQAVRDAIPVGVGGVALGRIPYNEQLVNLVNSGTYSKLIASVDRCIRVVEVPVKGGVAKAHCSRPCVRVGNDSLCPEHDKAAFQPQQDAHGTKARIINSASIPLTKGEEDELARGSKSFAEHGNFGAPPPAASAPVAVAPTVPVSRAEMAQALNISIRLNDLAAGDIKRVLAEAVCSALDELPAGNMRQMKQVVALQEQVTRLFLKTRKEKRNGRRKADAETDSL